MTYYKQRYPDIKLEGDIMIYDRISGTKLLVTLDELKRDYRQYYDFRVYEGVSGNKLISDWLEDHKDDVPRCI